jgi:hypothetical protein
MVRRRHPSTLCLCHGILRLLVYITTTIFEWLPATNDEARIPLLMLMLMLLLRWWHLPQGR